MYEDTHNCKSRTKGPFSAVAPEDQEDAYKDIIITPNHSTRFCRNARSWFKVYRSFAVLKTPTTVIEQHTYTSRKLTSQKTLEKHLQPGRTANCFHIGKVKIKSVHENWWLEEQHQALKCKTQHRFWIQCHIYPSWRTYDATRQTYQAVCRFLKYTQWQWVNCLNCRKDLPSLATLERANPIYRSSSPNK